MNAFLIRNCCKEMWEHWEVLSTDESMATSMPLATGQCRQFQRVFTIPRARSKPQRRCRGGHPKAYRPAIEGVLFVPFILRTVHT